MLLFISGETEEEFSTRLAKNLEDLILKEGPETVKSSYHFVTCMWKAGLPLEGVDHCVTHHGC